MKCVFLLTLVALLHVSTAYPTIQLRAEKADLSERCPVTIEIPRWFCNAMESKVRPDWLNTICEAVEPTPETQSISMEDICRQPTVDARVRLLHTSCTEGRISGLICEADRHHKEEVIRSMCGNNREIPPMGYPARVMQRGRRSSSDYVDVICSSPRDPDTMILVGYLCRDASRQHLLGHLIGICFSTQYREQELIRLCGGMPATRAKGTGTNGLRWTRRRGKVSTTTGPMYSKEECQVFRDSRFPTWFEELCENKERKDVPNYDVLRSLCNESNPVEVLLRGCPLASEQVDAIPEHICSQLEKPGYASFLYLVSRPNEMDPETYNITRSVCNNLEELPKRCGIHTGAPTSRLQTLDSDVEDKREITRIPDWICNNLSKLGLPEFIGSVCKTNDRLSSPDEMCKPSLELPNVPERFP